MRRREILGTARFGTFSCYRRLPLLNNDLMKDEFAGFLLKVLARQRVLTLAWALCAGKSTASSSLRFVATSLHSFQSLR